VGRCGLCASGAVGGGGRSYGDEASGSIKGGKFLD
jgi:hypothetical protein